MTNRVLSATRMEPMRLLGGVLVLVLLGSIIIHVQLLEVRGLATAVGAVALLVAVVLYALLIHSYRESVRRRFEKASVSQLFGVLDYEQNPTGDATLQEVEQLLQRLDITAAAAKLVRCPASRKSSIPYKVLTARVLRALGDEVGLERTVDELRRERDNSEVLYLMTILATGRQDYLTAWNYCRRAVNLDPGDARFALHAGFLSRRLDRKSLAIRETLRALSCSKNLSPMVRYFALNNLFYWSVLDARSLDELIALERDAAALEGQLGECAVTGKYASDGLDSLGYYWFRRWEGERDEKLRARSREFLLLSIRSNGGNLLALEHLRKLGGVDVGADGLVKVAD